MPDPAVSRWKQNGLAAFWREPKSDHWNLTADDECCRSLIELIDLMQNAQWSSRAQVSLTMPDRTANGDVAGAKFAKSIEICYPKDQVGREHWEIRSDQNLSLEIGFDRLFELRSVVNDIRVGNGDYSIGSDANPLWVWWWVNSPNDGG